MRQVSLNTCDYLPLSALCMLCPCVPFTPTHTHTHMHAVQGRDKQAIVPCSLSTLCVRVCVHACVCLCVFERTMGKQEQLECINHCQYWSKAG